MIPEDTSAVVVRNTRSPRWEPLWNGRAPSRSTIAPGADTFPQEDDMTAADGVMADPLYVICDNWARSWVAMSAGSGE